MANTRRRERELARAKYERQQARRQQQRRRRRRVNAVVGTAVTLAVILGGAAFALTRGAGPATTAAASPSPGTTGPATTPSPAAAKPCAYTPAATPAAKNVGVPVFDAAQAVVPYTATLRTTAGDVTFQSLSAQAPCASFSFRFLAGKKYFDGTTCHRLTTSPTLSVLQCGDPSGTGRGGPGYAFPDENLTGATYPAGTVAMANSGPDTNGSQFFLVYQDSQLPPSYTPFGRITAGLDVLRKVAAAGTANGTPDGAPKTPVTISTVTIAP